MTQPAMLAALATLPTLLAAQIPTLSASDSALVGRILLAEDRRDSTDGALAEGSRHPDSRVRTLARRAYGRIRDPRFAVRDSLPPLPGPVAWPEPAWRLRYRALATRRDDCAALRSALADSVWPVRLRAMDLVTQTCATDDALASELRRWIDAVPANAARRSPGNVSWHAAAHAVVALARIRPDEARPRLRRLAAHRQWQVRMYTARAAAALADTAPLRALARDRNDNVKEVAIESLAKLTGHADDDVFLAALGADGAQAVRAAAIALKGSPRSDVAGTASKTFDRWVARANASERDVRVALLEAAGRPATDDRPPATRVALPPQAVALALGEEVRLRVTIAPSSGGGSFVVRLRGDVAPMMAARILALARRKYYDGLTWHRVEHDFVVQGLSPDANEYVGLAQYLRDELGTVPHVRGTVGMSTRGHDTGDAQWFVNLKDNLRLNRDYTVFAEVVEGIDVVDGILEGDAVASVTVERGASSRPGQRRLSLGQCALPGVDGEARCGVHHVPQDRRRPTGRTIPLFVAVLPARESPAAPDPVFVIAGGPGQGASSLADFWNRILADVRRHRDIVIVDVAGTGRSGALRCTMYLSARDLVGDLYRLDRVRACRDSLARHANLRRYVTSTLMDDLDDVRAALGYRTINIYGTSYGSRAALEYARRHRAHVRSIVVKAVAPATMRGTMHYAHDMERSIQYLVRACAADAACASAFPSFAAELHEVLRRADLGTLRGAVPDPNGGPAVELPLSRGTVASTFLGILQSSNTAVQLPFLVHTAFRGDTRPLVQAIVRYRRGIDAGISLGMYLSVMCSEDAPRMDPAAAAVADRGTVLGEYRVAQLAAACREWPRGDVPPDHATPIRSDVPILLVSGTLDPNTNERWGEDAARYLSRATHVVIPNQSHGFTSFAECGSNFISEFIARASAEGIDFSCKNRVRLPPFVVPGDGR